MKKILILVMLSMTFLFASIDLNSASKEELMSLKGIGEKKAERIIAFRQEQKFQTIEDLKQVKGFGKKLVERLKNELKVKKSIN